MNAVIACFLLFNVKTQQIEKTIGKLNCEQQLPAASTFKVPLAVMAFDSGVLKDENQILKWDGKKRWNPEWNKDQDAKSWMKYSVVWFSQLITPKLGLKKADNYLKQFEYGTGSLAPGLTTAWLNSPLDPKGALKISGYEQLEFMKKLWSDKLPVSKRSMEITRKVTYLETSPNHFELSGKTGTNNYTDKKKMEIGWFVAHIQKGDKEYISVYNFRQERKPDSDYAGPRAREITKELLKKENLW